MKIRESQVGEATSSLRPVPWLLLTVLAVVVLGSILSTIIAWVVRLDSAWLDEATRLPPGWDMTAMLLFLCAFPVPLAAVASLSWLYDHRPVEELKELVKDLLHRIPSGEHSTRHRSHRARRVPDLMVDNGTGGDGVL